MRPILIPFKPVHISMMQPRENIEIDRIVHKLELLPILGPAYTGVVGDKIIGCGGIIRLWPGCGEVWTIFSVDIALYPFWLHRTVKAILNTGMEGLGLHRIQAVAKYESERNCKWLDALGFAFEGPLVAFDQDGTDYERFALIRRKNG